MGKLVAERFEVRRGSVEYGVWCGPGQDYIGPQPGFILQVLVGRQGPGLGNLLRGPNGGPHALADVEEYDPHGIAGAVLGGQRLRPQQRAGDGQGEHGHGQHAQAQDEQVAEQVHRAPLVDRLAHEAQRGERHARGPGPREPMDHQRRGKRGCSDPDRPKVKKGHFQEPARSTKNPPKVCK